jgi:hypothetical protein
MDATQQVWEKNEIWLKQGMVDCGFDLQKAVLAFYAKASKTHSKTNNSSPRSVTSNLTHSPLW